MKILIADDSTAILKIMKNALVASGVAAENIIEAKDGQDAITKFFDQKPELIFTDWNMPILNGLEFVQKVRSFNQTVPIVMVTSEGRKTEVLTALRSGVNDYIVKPFKVDTIKEKLTKYYNKAQ